LYKKVHHNIYRNRHVFLYFQDLQRDIKDHEPSHDDVNSTTTKHLDVCKKEPEEEPVTEQEQVGKQLEKFNDRWEKLKADVDDSTKQVENVEKEVNKMIDKEKTLDDLFKDVEKELDEQKPVNVNPQKCESNLNQVKVRLSLSLSLSLSALKFISFDC